MHLTPTEELESEFCHEKELPQSRIDRVFAYSILAGSLATCFIFHDDPFVDRVSRLRVNGVNRPSI